MNYSIETVVCGAYAENCYILLPEDSAQAVLIDPGDDLFRLKRALTALGRSVGAILLTHGHFDHILSTEPLMRAYAAPVYAAAEEIEMLNDPAKNSYDASCSSRPCPKAIDAIAIGDAVEVCGLRFEVLPTPGHTKGSVCYYDREHATLFSGDTLFCAGFGRMDLYGGSPRAMRESLRKLFALPGETVVFSGHGSTTTIGDECARYDI